MFAKGLFHQYQNKYAISKLNQYFDDRYELGELNRLRKYKIMQKRGVKVYEEKSVFSKSESENKNVEHFRDRLKCSRIKVLSQVRI